MHDWHCLMEINDNKEFVDASAATTTRQSLILVAMLFQLHNTQQLVPREGMQVSANRLVCCLRMGLKAVK